MKIVHRIKLISTIAVVSLLLVGCGGGTDNKATEQQSSDISSIEDTGNASDTITTIATKGSIDQQALDSIQSTGKEVTVDPNDSITNTAATEVSADDSITNTNKSEDDNTSEDRPGD